MDAAIGIESIRRFRREANFNPVAAIRSGQTTIFKIKSVSLPRRTGTFKIKTASLPGQTPTFKIKSPILPGQETMFKTKSARLRGQGRTFNGIFDSKAQQNPIFGLKCIKIAKTGACSRFQCPLPQN